MPKIIFQCALAPRLLKFTINKDMYVKPVKVEFYDEFNSETIKYSYSQEEFDEIYKVSSLIEENSGIAYPRLEINQVIVSGEKYKVLRTNKKGQEETLVYSANKFKGRYIYGKNVEEVTKNYQEFLISEKRAYNIALEKEEEESLTEFEEYKDPLVEVASDWFSNIWYNDGYEDNEENIKTDDESDFSRQNNGSSEEQDESSGNVHS